MGRSWSGRSEQVGVSGRKNSRENSTGNSTGCRTRLSVRNRKGISVAAAGESSEGEGSGGYGQRAESIQLGARGILRRHDFYNDDLPLHLNCTLKPVLRFSHSIHRLLRYHVIAYFLFIFKYLSSSTKMKALQGHGVFCLITAYPQSRESG